MRVRFIAITLIFGVAYALLGFHLYRLQIEKGFYYVKTVQARNEAAAELELRRGQIFFTDRSSTLIPVALNRDYPAIYAVPKEIKNPTSTAAAFASILNWKEEELAEVLDNPQSLFKLLVDKAAPEQIEAVNNLAFPGIHVSEKQYRFYPFEKLASGLLGFAGINKNVEKPTGLYGVEKFHDETLAEGKDVKLTVDRNLQAQSEQILRKLVEDYQAAGGSIIIEEPATGKILTLANEPGFNPNEYKDYPVKNFINPAVQYVYESGSVFKPLTMATGIELSAFTPTTTFVDTGSVTLNGKTIKNSGEQVYGKVDMITVIAKSINTGAVYAEKLIGNARFLEYVKKFGFGAKTGIDLSDEVPGSVKNLEKKDARAIDFATASFGQGTAITPLQLVNAFSVLANGGLLMRPYLNQELKPMVIRRVISEETARQVVAMLVTAVERVGVAVIPGFNMAGKTGTAQVPDFEIGGYTDEFIHSFAGFAPASNPRFVILIKLDKPKQGELARETVMPAFRELAQFILNYYNVAPDKLIEENSNSSHN